MLSYQEGRYEDALLKFTQALQVVGFDPHLSYNAALCHFKLKEFTAAQKYIGRQPPEPFAITKTNREKFQQTSSRGESENIPS
jgi:Tfp pilus assembly protein PilF